MGTADLLSEVHQGRIHALQKRRGVMGKHFRPHPQMLESAGKKRFGLRKQVLLWQMCVYPVPLFVATCYVSSAKRVQRGATYMLFVYLASAERGVIWPPRLPPPPLGSASVNNFAHFFSQSSSIQYTGKMLCGTLPGIMYHAMSIDTKRETRAKPPYWRTGIATFWVLCCEKAKNRPFYFLDFVGL